MNTTENQKNEPAAGETKYQYIVRVLMNDILAGRLVPYETIPSERALMRRFAVARQTVRQAIQSLQARGLVRARHGRGTFVSGKYFNCRKLAVFAPCGKESAFLTELKTLADAGRLDLAVFAAPSDGGPAAAFAAAHAFAARLLDEEVSGVLYAPAAFGVSRDLRHRELLALFRAAGVPVVLIGGDVCDEPEQSGFDVVRADEVNGGRTIVRHLREAGARSLRFLVSGELTPSLRARLCGCCDEACRAADALRVVADPADPIAVSGLFFASPEIDAIICANDADALKLKASLTGLGLRVPEDIRITGCDEGDGAGTGQSLTSLAPSYAALARVAFERLRVLAADPLQPCCTIEIGAPLLRGKTT